MNSERVPGAARPLTGGWRPTDVGTALLAAATMVATLPGRTHGVGLVTEPLLAEFGLGRVPFAALNFWATVVGAAFCLPAGSAIDRFGTRNVLAVVATGLGAAVVAMAGLPPAAASLGLPAPEWLVGGGALTVAVPPALFLLVLLTRGLGQSALSVVSLAIVGKGAGARPARTIGLYSCLVALGFMAAFAAVKGVFEGTAAGWRDVWRAIGVALVAFGTLAPWFLPRGGVARRAGRGAGAADGPTLRDALAAPAFWVFGLATGFYALVAAGMALFNQSILAERGFDRSVFLTVTSAAPLVGLVANLVGGWAAARVPIGRVAAAGLVLQAAALACFPAVGSLPGVYAYAAAMAFGGGLLTVVFFAVWREGWGTSSLGAIQGAAQVLTVVASAAGPLVLAVGRETLGSYAPIALRLSAASALLAVATLLVPLPDPRPLPRSPAA
ncbi:MAG: MFS transporter [Planctomycetaceae bacterium]